MNSEFDDLTDRTADLMGLADVKRWGVIRTLRDQNVAEHSFGVAVIAMDLLTRLNIDDKDVQMEVLSWALIHDLPEVLTGDIDGKFKRDYPNVKEELVKAEMDAFVWYRDFASQLYMQTNAIVKLADKMESISFIRVWGIGGRADDVRRELEALTFKVMVPKVAEVLDIPAHAVAEIVHHMLNHSLAESNTVQLRRYRDNARG